MKTKKTAVAPKDASKVEVERITRDLIHLDNYWMIVLPEAESVVICEQHRGHNAKSKIAIPRKDFNRLIRWYLKPQKFIRK